MKAFISDSEVLTVVAESHTEAYALICWSRANLEKTNNSVLTVWNRSFYKDDNDEFLIE